MEPTTHTPTPRQEPVAQYKTRLEDKDLRITADGYPEEMRDPLIWLGVYLREKNHRNLDVLERKVKSLGLSTSVSTFQKLFTGRWNRTAQGQSTSPIISIPNFLQLVEALKRQARIDEMAGKVPFIETGTYETIRDYIDIRRAPDRVCKFGLIVGPTGAQKSACFKYYTMVNNHGACSHMEAPDSGSMRAFEIELCYCLGVSPNVLISPQLRDRRIRENITATKTLIIDNIQRLYQPDEGWNQPVFNKLQKLQDDTNCTIIMCCVPEFELLDARKGKEADYFEQFEGRCGGREEYLFLPEFTPMEDIIQIAKEFKTETTKRMYHKLEELSRRRGRIRIMFNALQNARKLADTERSSILTLQHLLEVINQPAPLEKAA